MPVSTTEIIDFLSQLSEEEKLRVTFNESLKGGIIAGVSAALGGLALGPPGLAVGGTVGSIAAAFYARNKFLPVGEIIRHMEPEKQEILAENIRRIMQSVNVTDVAVLLPLIAGDDTVKQRIITSVVDHLRTELSMAIVDH